eukprot:5972480-Prorocentrum_lima.AAC.1
MHQLGCQLQQVWACAWKGSQAGPEHFRKDIRERYDRVTLLGSESLDMTGKPPNPPRHCQFHTAVKPTTPFRSLR